MARWSSGVTRCAPSRCVYQSDTMPWGAAETLHALAVRSADRRDENPEFAGEHAALALAIKAYETARDSAHP